MQRNHQMHHEMLGTGQRGGWERERESGREGGREGGREEGRGGEGQEENEDDIPYANSFKILIRILFPYNIWLFLIRSSSLIKLQ